MAIPMQWYHWGHSKQLTPEQEEKQNKELYDWAMEELNDINDMDMYEYDDIFENNVK